MDEYRFGPFTFNPVSQALTRDGSAVPLGSRATDILSLLLRSPGKLCSNEEILAHAWPATFVDQSNLRVHVSAIRKALGETRGQPGYIVNSPGRGYRFVGAVRPATLPPPGPAPGSADGIIGRRDAIAAIAGLIPGRMVTVVGPGGIGKTTVVRAVIAALEARSRVLWIDFAELSSGTLLRSSLATALGLPSNDPDNLETLVAALTGQDSILVLDSCEHVVDDVAALVEMLRERVPLLTIIATSREPLRVATERLFRLPPLDLPPPDIAPETVAPTSAMQLFAERAAAQVGDMDLSGERARLVAEICQRLDGIPLAIELAAARLESVSLGELSASLTEGFRLLTHGRRAAVPRHRTLRATLDWSYDALTAEQQRALQHLSVLRGWFSFATACGVLSDLSDDVLHELVSKSLLVADRQTARTRYRLLEMTRHYGAEKLADAGRFDVAMRGLTEFLIGALEAAEAVRPFAGNAPHLAELLPNLRIALAWCRTLDPARGVALTVASVPLFLSLSLLHECLTHVCWGTAFLDDHPGLDERSRMQLHATRVWPQMRSACRPEEDVTAAHTALSLAKELGDVDYQLRALWALWVDAVNRSRPLQALRLAEDFRARAETSPDPVNQVVGLRLVGATLHWLGRFTESQDHLRRMLTGYAALASPASAIRFQFDQRVSAQVMVTRNLWIMGEESAALDLLDDTIRRASDAGHDLSLANYLAEAACLVALLSGRLELSEQLIAQLRRQARGLALTVWEHYADCFEAVLHLHREEPARCLELMSRSVAALDTAGSTLFHTYFRSVQAQALCALGRGPEALRELDEAQASCAASGERWCLAELLRVRSRVLLAGGRTDARARCAELLRSAIDAATADGALAWERRARADLAQLIDPAD
ncbi:winged helix-turn-helix domain-containing protein [Paroceanicella profunda]|uniref:winged helix-turn-helix domain-containing protein n=1 Tax=Paroceanicella profunda TaxID=2579971 RepID=UPI001478C587|nr:winged helix-turn-helix domain-containing protein [Paroceanicella profunda]